MPLKSRAVFQLNTPLTVSSLCQMPVRMRLARLGRTHNPFYRIVVADSRRARLALHPKQSPERVACRDGKHLEVVGTYDPIPNKNNEKVS